MEQKPPDYFRFGDPKGVEGREAMESMNSHHKDLSEWAMTLLPSIKPDDILDVGCGGGMQLMMLGSKFPDAHLTGVDFSKDAVKFASKINKDKIDIGMCVIERAPAEKLPYPDVTFDLVSAFETYFFWSDLDMAFSEIYRVLRPTGVLMVISEQYPDPKFKERNDDASKRTGMKLVHNDKLQLILENAGFKVEYITLPEKNWVCFIAKKE